MANFRSIANRLKRQARKAEREARRAQRKLKQEHRKVQRELAKLKREASKVYFKCSCGKQATYHHHSVPGECPRCGGPVIWC